MVFSVWNFPTDLFGPWKVLAAIKKSLFFPTRHNTPPSRGQHTLKPSLPVPLRMKRNKLKRIEDKIVPNEFY